MASWLVIVAGPNGAGKSTFVSSGIIHRTISTPESAGFEILNPDAIARRAAKGDTVSDDANLTAVREVEASLRDAIRDGRSIGVETVLSTPKYRPIVEEALGAGYRVMLHYIVLSDSTLHASRVAQRAAQGGHDVEPAKIHNRFTRSLEQLPWFAAHASVAFVWDNSGLGGTGPGPVLLAEKTIDGQWSRFEEPPWLHGVILLALDKVFAGKT